MKTGIFRNKYFYSMLIRFLLPAVVSITLVGGIGTAVGYFILRTELETINHKLLRATLNHTELMLNEMDSIMLAFDINPLIINKCYHVLNTSTFGYTEHQDLRTIETYINAPVNSRQYIDSIYIYYPNPYGRFIRSNDRSGILGGGASEDWFASYMEHRDDTGIWSERRVNPFNGKHIVSIYQMLDHKGLLILNLDARYLGEILTSLQSFEEQSIYILNSDGQPLLQLGEDYDEEKIREAGDVTYRMYSERYQWSYISVIPEHVFYQIPLMIIRYTCLIIVLVSLAGIILSYLSTRHSYHQYAKLQSIIDAACKGKKVEEERGSEKTDYFGHMTQQLIQNFIEQDFLHLQLSERKYKLRSMELLAMQSQMNPHFLYNTLETIGWKIMGVAGGRTEANEMLEHLSEILAYSLDADHEYAPLEQEIHVTESYIKILQGRYGSQFIVNWKCDENVMGETTVKFILQPLIENAVNHGIREKEGGAGRIHVRIHVRKGQIHMYVADNGKGISPDKLMKLRNGLDEPFSSSSHIGIFNTNRRLKLAYGEEYGLKIQSKEGMGTVIIVKIPMTINEV